jgi:hypothetical protein
MPIAKIHFIIVRSPKLFDLCGRPWAFRLRSNIETAASHGFVRRRSCSM